MIMNETEQARAWAAQWAKAAPALEGIRREELAALDFARNWKMVDGLLAAGWSPGAPARECGLVEMERLLQKLQTLRAA